MFPSVSSFPIGKAARPNNSPNNSSSSAQQILSSIASASLARSKQPSSSPGVRHQRPTDI
eukprot:7809053-Lingulodinium_polyedra.AAC.1